MPPIADDCCVASKRRRCPQRALSIGVSRGHRASNSRSRGFETRPIADASLASDRPMRRRALVAVSIRCRTKDPASGELRGRYPGYCNREASMKRKAAGIVLTIGVTVAALAGTASAQNSTGSAVLDSSLRGAVEHKDVPGVVALITDRERVLYQGAFGVAD